MHARFIRDLPNDYLELEALQDGTILIEPGDHPTFGLESLKTMSLFVKKGEIFQIPQRLRNQKNLFIWHIDAK